MWVEFGCDGECFGEDVFGLLWGGFGFGEEGLYCSEGVGGSCADGVYAVIVGCPGVVVFDDVYGVVDDY